MKESQKKLMFTEGLYISYRLGEIFHQIFYAKTALNLNITVKMDRYLVQFLSCLTQFAIRVVSSPKTLRPH